MADRSTPIIKCKCCRHPRRKDLDAALDPRTKSFEELAADFDVSTGSLKRHAQGGGAKHNATAEEKVEKTTVGDDGSNVTAQPAGQAAVRASDEEQAIATVEVEAIVVNSVGRPCATCAAEPEMRAEIERLLASGMPAGTIARRYEHGPSNDSISRHLEKCVPIGVRNARALAMTRAPSGMLIHERAEEHYLETKRFLDETRGAPPGDRAKALQSVRASLELLAKIHGVLRPDSLVMLLEHPMLHRLVAAIREVACSECRPQILKALDGLGHRS